MDHIWTPWRKKYIEGETGDNGCVFCDALAKADSAENLIFFRGKFVFLILNRYPYTSGHVMCVPYAHVNRLSLIQPEAREELMDVTTRITELLQSCYHPDGFNLGMNLGAQAGAGVAEHIHMHIVPRWGGDTSFMTIVGQTRVLPETLAESYERIKTAWDESQQVTD